MNDVSSTGKRLSSGVDGVNIRLVMQEPSVEAEDWLNLDFGRHKTSISIWHRVETWDLVALKVGCIIISWGSHLSPKFTQCTWLRGLCTNWITGWGGSMALLTWHHQQKESECSQCKFHPLCFFFFFFDKKSLRWKCTCEKSDVLSVSTVFVSVNWIILHFHNHIRT